MNNAGLLIVILVLLLLALAFLPRPRRPRRRVDFAQRLREIEHTEGRRR